MLFDTFYGKITSADLTRTGYLMLYSDCAAKFLNSVKNKKNVGIA